MNPNWPRWIFASVTKYFVDTLNVEVFVHGTNRPTPQSPEFVELIVNGPMMEPLSGEVKIIVPVTFWYKVSMSEVNFHRKYTLAGEVAAAFQCIRLFRYGTGSDDDNEQFGILTAPEEVSIHHYGQIDKDVRLEQGSILGTYQTYLET